MLWDKPSLHEELSYYLVHKKMFNRGLNQDPVASAGVSKGAQRPKSPAASLLSKPDSPLEV